MTLSFTCPDCGKTSYNPNDSREQYCGHCHKFYVAVRCVITNLKTGEILYDVACLRSEEVARNAILGLADTLYPKPPPPQTP